MITRRGFTAAALALSAASALSRSAQAAMASSGAWRRFEVTTQLELAAAAGPAQAWIPLAAFDAPDWARVEANRWRIGGNARAERVSANGADLLHVQWVDGPGHVEVTSIVATRDRVVALDGRAAGAKLSPEERALHLRGSAHAPTDGIVAQTAATIVRGASTDLDKAGALYRWVVENTFRSASVRGCGDGDVVRMLRSGVLGGKCADINGLFVALARASGLPARDLYGIRVAPSRLGYASLGPATSVITKAQHCRAEVFLDGFGWVPMDPADVRKVMLEERPGGLPADEPRVAAARARLFGAWEGNWVPFNASQDVALPGRNAAPLAFLMYPQVETAAGLLDCYDPEAMRYAITATELSI